MQAVLLAAGLGTRLQPLTRNRSKAMVSLLGRPLIEWVLDTLLPHGIRELIFIVAPEDHLIRKHFEGWNERGISCRFVTQRQRLGMAHALHQAREYIQGPFLLSACDSFISTEFIGRMLRYPADAVLALEDVAPERVCRSASVRMENGNITAIIEKPRPEEAFSSTVSLPLYLLPADAVRIAGEIRCSSRGEYEIQDVISALIKGGARVGGIKTEERLQVSTPEDYLQLTTLLLDRKASVLPATPEGVFVHPPVLIETGAILGEGNEIGPHVVLERGCVLGDGIRLRHSVVFSGATIPSETIIENQLIF